VNIKARNGGMIIAGNFPILAIGEKKPEKKSGLQRDI